MSPDPPGPVQYYKYIIILFKLINISAIVQNLINNILIFLENEGEHKKHITKILKILKKAELRIELEKYTFYIYKIKYFRYIIFNQDINNQKIKNIKKYKKIIIISKTY